MLFVAVPVLVYDRLRTADEDRNRLLIASIEAEGRLIAEALRPELEKAGGAALAPLGDAVARLGTLGTDIKLLFRPAGGDGFFYVASSPAVPAQLLDGERRELARQGVLDRLASSCERAGTAGFRYTDPQGAQVLLTSITTLDTAAGCWVVLTADRSAGALDSSLGQPYWKTAAVGAAALIYLAMAAGVLALLLQMWFGLRRFGRLARELRGGQAGPGGFSQQNRIPELAGVAGEFDRLVDTLRASAEALRFTAQETAHAFKTPLGIIAQSLEPLRRRVADDARGTRALDLIDRALGRLDELVSAARSLDETLADTINPARERVDLSELVADIAAEYAEAHDPARLRVAVSVEPGCFVVGAAALTETILQNLIDNAISFSPPGGVVAVALRRLPRGAELSVADQGPGVAPDNLERIFDRFVSLRAGQGAATDGAKPAETPRGPANFGLGLWIVHRNVEVMGGVVAAENRPDGGLRVKVTLPLAS